MFIFYKEKSHHTEGMTANIITLRRGGDGVLFLS